MKMEQMMELMLAQLDSLQEDITERKAKRKAFREETRTVLAMPTVMHAELALTPMVLDCTFTPHDVGPTHYQSVCPENLQCPSLTA
jgi:hypothetical protein